MDGYKEQFLKGSYNCPQFSLSFRPVLTAISVSSVLSLYFGNLSSQILAIYLVGSTINPYIMILSKSTK